MFTPKDIFPPNLSCTTKYCFARYLLFIFESYHKMKQKNIVLLGLQIKITLEYNSLFFKVTMCRMKKQKHRSWKLMHFFLECELMQTCVNVLYSHLKIILMYICNEYFSHNLQTCVNVVKVPKNEEKNIVLAMNLTGLNLTLNDKILFCVNSCKLRCEDILFFSFKNKFKSYIYNELFCKISFVYFPEQLCHLKSPQNEKENHACT